MEHNPYQTPQGEITLPQSGYVKPTLKELLFSFEGRIPRRVFWGVNIISGIISNVITYGLMAIDENAGVIAMVVLLIPSIWISLAIMAKRWHDRDKSGMWFFIIFIPFVGAIWYLVECGCLRGTMGDNNYGPDPT